MSTRRIGVIGLLLALMFGLRTLSGLVAGGSSSALLSIGFVVLAAYALAELTSGFGLPRVTGWILAGVAVGPHTSGLITTHAVVDLQVFNTLALALIALEAGLELRIDGLKKVLKTLGGILLFKVPLMWFVVGGAFVAAAGLLPGETLGLYDRIGIGLIIGALSVGTSPAVSIAVISETGAKGKLPDLILAMAVFKDVVMIIMLAAALTIAGGLAEGGSLDLGVFKALGFKVAASVAAGVALGLAMIAWLKWVKWELVLVLLLLGYGVNTIADILHLKMLLVFIAAGFTVSNFSDYGHDLHKPLSLVALPVFVLFFTTVGAGLDLRAAVGVAPVALILFAARAGVMYVSTRVGSKIAGDPPAFGKRAWFGFISQAGVALGLLLVAKQEAPQFGAALTDTATVLISLNLLIGPILLRASLTSADKVSADAEGESSAYGAPLEPLQNAGLRAIFDTVDQKLSDLEASITHDVLDVWSAHALERSEQLDDTRLHALQPWRGQKAMAAADEATRSLRDFLADLPREHHADLGPEHLIAETAYDRRATVNARWLGTIGAKRRRIPVREAGRSQVEGHVLPALLGFIGAVYRAEAKRLDSVARQVMAGPDEQPLVSEAERVRADYRELKARLSREIDEARRRLHTALRLGGTPQLPARALRFMMVARDVHQAAVDLAASATAWGPVIEGAAARARTRLQVGTLHAHLGQTLEASLERWRESLKARAFDGVDRVMEALTETADRFAAARTDGVGSMGDLITSRRDALDTLCCSEVLPFVDAMRRDAVERSPLADAAEELPGLIEQLPESVAPLPAALELRGEPAALAEAIQNVSLRKTAIRHFESEFSWGLRDAEDSADRLIARLAQHLGEVAGVVTDVFTTALDVLDEEDPRAPMMALRTARRGLVQAQRVMSSARREMDTEAQLIGDEVARALAAAVDGTLHDALGPGATDRTSTEAPTPRIARPRSEDVAALPALFGTITGALGAPYRAVRGSEIVRDARRARGAELVGPADMR
ncbi:MAG: Kef-type K+ transport system membrane component KefB, partial [Myxococcota bacterium]